MPRPGGEADKLGNRYEGLWTVDAALDLLDGEYVDLTVEALGDEAAGVEFVRTTRAGIREYHSIKRQHARGNWTIPLLRNEGILADLVAKTGTASCAIFSSGTSATELEELIDRASASGTFEEFTRRIAGNARLSARFTDYVVPLRSGERAAWVALQRLDVRITNEPTLTTNVERRIRAMFRTASGGPLDPRAVRLLIANALTDPLGKLHSAKSVLEALEPHRIVRSQLAGEASIRERFEKLNRAHAAEISARLINRDEIVREESAAAEATLLERGKSVMIEGIAGSGKSCVLVQLIRRLEQHSVPHLVIRLDRLDNDDNNAQAIGARLGLPESPVITLGEFADDQPSVLLLDQLDALSIVSARNQAVWGALNELLDEARAYSNMQILFACRSFDLERDHRLRALAADKERVERVSVGPLEPEVVGSAVERAGLDPALLSEAQTEILAIPLHLHLLLESAGSGSLRFASARDLFDRFWEYKADAVSRQINGGAATWVAVVARLCDEMSEREALAAPSVVLDEYGEALSVVASESVVSVDGGDVRFFHESFFDYAFARAFVRANRDLTQWLLSGEQHLFRRSQVRQVLEFLRGSESDRDRYLETVAALLGRPGVRFHIRKLVLDWLGSRSDPTPDEWRIVEGLEEELGEHIWGVARNSAPWFDVLQQMGRWELWLAADDGRTDHAVTLLRMPNVLRGRSAEIAFLVGRFRGVSEEWRRRLAWLVGGGYGYTSEEMRQLVIDLVTDGTLDDVRPGVAVNDDWWSTWYGLGTEQPEFVARLLGAWFDRQIARAAALGREDPFSGVPELFARSQFSGALIGECAAAAPLAFSREIFPKLARFDRSTPKTWIAAPSDFGGPDDQLREALAQAMCTIARRDPDALDAIVGSVAYGDSTWMCALLLRAWSANPDIYADRVVRFLLEHPDRRLNIGYAFGMGGADILAAVSRTAVAAVSRSCSDELYAQLEGAILHFATEWEKKNRYRGRTEFALLRSLDEERISAKVHQRIQELQRRFPRASGRGAPLPRSEGRGTTWVGSPISGASQRHMTDDQWLAAMAKYSCTEERARHDGTTIGGAIELSRALTSRVREAPDRFSRLAEQMDASLHAVYFEAVLSGLTHEEDAERAGTLEQVCRVLRRIAEIEIPVSDRARARAIGTLADEDIPEEIVQTLCEIAENATDPQEDRWRDGGESSVQTEGEKCDGVLQRVMDFLARLPILGRIIRREATGEESRGESLWPGPIDQAINSTRGTAAFALASLLFADRDRWPRLRPTVELLVVDPVLAVRSVAVSCLLAILDSHREDALAGFASLAEGADTILGSNHVERFVHFAMYRDYLAMRPRLVTMLHSAEPATVEAGARQMILAGLWMDEAREDGDLVLGLGEAARVGAAAVYAGNVSDTTVASECEERLKLLFADESKSVREAASRCWDTLGPDEITKRRSLLGAFAQAFDAGLDVGLLVYTLARSYEELPPEVCELAEKVVNVYGTKGGDPRLREAAVASKLVPLTLRLHEQTRDADLRRRVLDVIDEMLRVGFMEVSEHLDRS